MAAKHCDEAGLSTLEFVIAAPMLLLILFSIVYAARATESQGRVHDAAQAAARAASRAHSAALAEAAGTDAASQALAERGVSCRSMAVEVNLADFRTGGSVVATVTCGMDRSELAILGLGGVHAVRASFSSPVDVAATVGP